MYIVHVGILNFRSCRLFREIITSCIEDPECLAILTSGGVGYCYRELVHASKNSVKILSIPIWSDDVFTVKILKELDYYASGKWIRIWSNVVVGGIDGQDPYQSMNRLLHELTTVVNCERIILTHYVPSTLCDYHPHLGIEVGVPELFEFLARVKPRLTLCSSMCYECFEDKEFTVVNTPPLETGVYTRVHLGTWDVEFEYR